MEAGGIPSRRWVAMTSWPKNAAALARGHSRSPSRLGRMDESREGHAGAIGSRSGYNSPMPPDDAPPLRDDLREVFEQLAEGRDFPSPSGLLGGVSAARAERRREGMPYSLADNLAHAARWQEEWLAKFDGEKRPVGGDDWRPAEPGEYAGLRARFVEGIDRAAKLAERDDLTPGDRVRLVRIALHAAYHLGQMNLLKRIG